MSSKQANSAQRARRQARPNTRARGINAYVASAREARTGAPVMSRTKSGGERIRHSELVATVNGSVAFAANKFVVNPGDATTFPWLSGIAQRYEEYRFHALRFELLTRSATSTVGSVILAPEYNAGHPDPVSESQVCAYKGAVEDAPWRDIVCPLNAGDMHSLGARKFVRNGNVAGDVKTYDAASMYVCTLEEANTNAIGKLWVHYDVELEVPQLDGTSTASENLAFFNLSADQTLTSTVEATLAFDEEVENSLGITNAAGVFTLPRGSYLVQASAGVTLGGLGAQSCVMSLQADSAALVPPVFERRVSNGDDTEQAQHLFGYVESDGTTTCRVRLLATSSGTLTAGQDECRVVFRCV